MWIKKFLKDIGIMFSKLVLVFCDKTRTINLSKNMVLHSKTKHIEIKFHVLRDKKSEKEIILDFVSTREHLANIFTKPLPKDAFKLLRGMIGVMSMPTSE